VSSPTVSFPRAKTFDDKICNLENFGFQNLIIIDLILPQCTVYWLVF